MITSVGAAFGSAALAVAPAGCFISAVGAAFGSAALAVAPAGCSVAAGMRAQAAGRSASSIVPAPSALLHDAYLIVHLLLVEVARQAPRPSPTCTGSRAELFPNMQNLSGRAGKLDLRALSLPRGGNKKGAKSVSLGGAHERG